MRDEELSPTHDIELLKQKITLYKDTLTTLKTGDSIEDYQFLKNEFQHFKTKITNFADVIENMDEKQNKQIKGYKQEIKNLSTQIDSLNLIVEELNQNFLLVMKTQNSNQGKPKFNLPNQLTPSRKQSIPEGNFTQQPPPSNATPTYKQLQNIGTRMQSLNELPTENTQNSKPPAVAEPPVNPTNSSLNSSRRFNELHKNNPPMLNGKRNQPVPAKRISIKFSNTQSYPLTNDKQVNDRFEKEPVATTENVALVETKEEPIQKAEEKVPVSIETKQVEEAITVSSKTEQAEIAIPVSNKTEQVEEAIPVSIETIQVEEPIPVSSKTEQVEEVIPFSSETEQEEPHKEPLSILRFFRKR